MEFGERRFIIIGSKSNYNFKLLAHNEYSRKEREISVVIALDCRIRAYYVVSRKNTVEPYFVLLSYRAMNFIRPGSIDH